MNLTETQKAALTALIAAELANLRNQALAAGAALEAVNDTLRHRADSLLDDIARTARAHDTQQSPTD